MKKKGKFIVLYGANNLGKSTQIELLVNALKKDGKKVKKIKYPVYDLEPTGSLINEVLRKGKKMDALSHQKLYAQNRRDFEPQLEVFLNEGYWVIAEDYVGTGLVWGLVGGASRNDLNKANAGLLKEDLAILLDGEQLKTGIEDGHINEIDERRWHKARTIHQELGKELHWIVVQANQPIAVVHDDIMQAVNKINKDK